MPTADELAALAREMKNGQDHARSLAPFTARISDFDLPAAYAVAGASCLRGQRGAGGRYRLTLPGGRRPRCPPIRCLRGFFDFYAATAVART